MKTLKRVGMLLALVLLAVTVIAPLPVVATNDDFDITYTVEPSLVGYKGADVNIGIRVENKGTTNITGFKVTVTTIAGYEQMWTGTITPGTTRPTVVFSVPFAEADLNVDKLLYVAIENDGSAPGSGDYMRDGTQVRTFQVEGTYNIFRIMKNATPGGSAYRVGDTVTFSYNFENTITTHAATAMTTEGHIFVGGDHVFASAVDSHGTVMPGGSVSTHFSYTFTNDDVGSAEVFCHASYTMMGKSYSEPRGTWIYFDVLPPREFGFYAELSASPATIDAGDEVTFTTEVTDTGETTLTAIELRNAEGGLMDVLPPIPVGGTRSFVTTADIFETTDVSYVVICADDYGNSASQETNTVRITVREPEESPTASAAETSTPTAAPTVTNTPIPSATEAPQESVSPDDEKKAQHEAQKDDNLVLYIIIGALGLLILAGAAVITVLLVKRRQRGSGRKGTL